MPRYWVGPLTWDSDQQCWRQPALANAMLDLRSTVHCGIAGPTPNGHGLFITPNAVNLGSDYTNLGTDADVVLSGQQKLSWQSRFGLPNTLAAQTLKQAVWETLTIQADPTGEDRCGPIVPTITRMFELWIGGERVFERDLAPGRDEWLPVIDMLKRQYRSIRQQCLDGVLPPNHYRKVLGYWVRKYRRHYREFQPADVPDESDVEPTTTITESFNTADGDTLGPNLTWAEVVGDWDIVSNRAQEQSAGSSVHQAARAETDLSSADHYAQAKCYLTTSGTGIGNVGVAARFASAATTFYEFHYRERPDTPEQSRMLAKVVTGTQTSLATTSSVALTDGDVLKVEISGSSLKGYRNGAQEESVTDTAITSNLRTGLYSLRSSATASSVPEQDDFEAADLLLFIPQTIFII